MIISLPVTIDHLEMDVADSGHGQRHNKLAEDWSIPRKTIRVEEEQCTQYAKAEDVEHCEKRLHRVLKIRNLVDEYLERLLVKHVLHFFSEFESLFGCLTVAR